VQISHHGRVVELDDAWWSEAEMGDFVPSRPHYRFDESNRSVFIVPLLDVSPVGRDHLAHGLFRSRKAVVDILKAFRTDAPLPPVEMVSRTSGPYPYTVTEGVHRIYCSIFAGFTHIPAVNGRHPGPAPE
jgi:hypothetical protein